MATGIIDQLEAVEVEEAERVVRIAGLGGVDRLLQAALEFAPVDQAGERVMARLVGHLPRDAAQLAGIVQHEHGTERAAILAAQRRDVELDAVFRRAARRQQERPPAHTDPVAGG